MVDVVLASGSPRRKELLSLLGVAFEVDTPYVDEHTDLPVKEAVCMLSRRKAEACARKHPGQVILAADTLVSIDQMPLGKPADAQDAARILRALSGRWHQVYTGVCCISREGKVFTGVDESSVRFSELSDSEIYQYIATGEPMDKAGAYALQGIAGAFIEEIVGNPSGVIGLPLSLTRKYLKLCGIPVLCNDKP